MTAQVDPALRRIIANIVAAVQAIKGQAATLIDSTAYRYWNTFDDDAVVTEPVPLATVQKTPFVIVGHRIEAKGRETTGLTSTSVKETWGIVLEGRVNAATLDALARVDAFAKVVADLEVALRADVTRGGVALYTVLGQATPYFGAANDPAVYFEQPVDVTLRRTYGVP